MDSQPDELPMDEPLDSQLEGYEIPASQLDEIPMDFQPDELPMDSKPDELPMDSQLEGYEIPASQLDEIPMDSQPDELPMDSQPTDSNSDAAAPPVGAMMPPPAPLGDALLQHKRKVMQRMDEIRLGVWNNSGECSNVTLWVFAFSIRKILANPKL